MRKRTFKLKKLVNTSINKGDKVRLNDGSALAHITLKEDFYINNAYPEVTGYGNMLCTIDAEVIETGITNRICPGVLDNAYLQDIVIKVGKAKFRTCSAFVSKI